MSELKKVLELLQLEKAENQKHYQETILQTPLTTRRQSGNTWYPIKINHYEVGLGENYLLTVERTTHFDTPHHFQTGARIALFHQTESKKERPQIEGVVVHSRKDSMKIAIGMDELPDWIDDGHLGVDIIFDDLSYKEMENGLQQVIKAEKGRLKELRDVLLGKKTPEFSKSNFALELPLLNNSQNQAVQNILAAKDVAIIHGPPGTGKTTTLVQAIKQTLKKEKQVLVCAPSNTAVDLLTLKLAQEGLSVARIGHPARVNEALLEYSLAQQITTHGEYKLLKKLRKEADEYRKLAGKYKRNFGKEERAQRKLMYAEARKIKEQAQNTEKYIIDSLLDNAQVITATLVGSMNKYIRQRNFSSVFIDEAAQALEPACWLPIIKSERVIFAGDHCQLPPTVKSFEAAKAGLENTLFEKCIQNQEVDVMLETQYRMHEHIMQFSNDIFYKGQLQADQSVAQHLLQNEPPSSPVEFIDTAGCGFEESTHPESLSKINAEEAHILLKHLEALLQEMPDLSAKIQNQEVSVGIISPYKAQVNYLKEVLANHPTYSKLNKYIDINSVDGFQGQERDVIYMSLVRSNENGDIGFLKDTRRMNVAMTRARKKLVMIGDSGTLANHSFYQQFLDYADQIQAYRSAWEYMG